MKNRLGGGLLEQIVFVLMSVLYKVQIGHIHHATLVTLAQFAQPADLVVIL